MTSLQPIEPAPLRLVGEPRRLRIGAALALTGAVLVAHGRGLAGAFVYDDLELVLANPALVSIDRLPRALTTAYWDFLDPETASRIGYWRPLSAVALFFGRAVAGGHPAGFHALSVALHALAVLLAWRFARRLFETSTRAPAFAAFASALFFALHPVHVESVAWISAVNVPLAGLFGFGFLGSWLAWKQRGATGLPLAPTAWFLAALLSKETSVALLPLAAALEFAVARRGAHGSRSAQHLRAGWPWLAGASLFYFGARVAVFQSPWGGLDRVTTDLAVSAGRAIALRVELLGELLRLLVWPHPLSAFREVQPERAPGDPTLWLALGLIALWLSAIGVLAWRGRRTAAFLAAFAPLTLLPVVLRIESLGRFLASDRFLYLPAFGVSALVALLATRLPRTLGAVALVALGGVLAQRTWQRTGVWRDEHALFESEARLQPDSAYVQWGLGRVLLERYRTSGDLALVARARSAFERVGELHDRMKAGDATLFASPDDFLQANLGLGWSYLLEAQALPPHEYETSEAIFRATLASFPRSEDAHTGLGAVLRAQGRVAEARAAFERALELDPLSWEAWLNLARLELDAGEADAARRAFEQVLARRAGDTEAAFGLGLALALGGKTELARERFAALAEHAAAPPATRAKALVQLGNLAAAGGAFADAIARYDDALTLAPGEASAWLHRGQALVALGRPAPALEAFQQACALDPRNFRAHYNFAALLVQSGQPGLALEVYEHALTLDPPPELRAPLEAEIERLRAL